MNDTVSICVPIFNTEKYLTRCINSLLAQTYRNLEIVLVNDGSSDNCGSICDAYGQMDSRIVVIHKENGGEASARNAGLRAATGDYIMFIDSDDEYLPNAVDLLLAAAKDDEVDLVIGGYLERRGQIEHFGTGHLRRYSAKEAALGYLNPDCNYGFIYIISSVNAKLFRHQIISTNNLLFDERFVVGNDMVFICEYLKHTRTIYDVFTPIYVYYKFHLSERVQGMAWHYPDAFLLFAYVADKMIKIAEPDEFQFKQYVIKQYKDLLYGLVSATANRAFLKNGLMPYFTSFCDEIDLLQIGARLDLAEDLIKKEGGALPIRLISYYIANKRFSELYEMLQVISKARNVVPFEGENVRQMIQVGHEPRKNQSESSIDDVNLKKDEHFPDKFSFTDDKLLVEQVNELVTTIAASQQQINIYEAKVSDYEAIVSDCEAKVNDCEAKVSDCEAKVSDYAAKISDYAAKISDYAAKISDYEAKISDCEAKVSDYAAKISDYEAKISDCEAKVSDYEAKISDYEVRVSDYEAKINTFKSMSNAYELEINKYAHSTSWRITKPFRVIMGLLRNLRSR